MGSRVAPLIAMSQPRHSTPSPSLVAGFLVGKKVLQPSNEQFSHSAVDSNGDKPFVCLQIQKPQERVLVEMVDMGAKKFVRFGHDGLLRLRLASMYQMAMTLCGSGHIDKVQW